MGFFRLDGVRVEKRTLHQAFQQPNTNRLKGLGGQDIAERRMPQDGIFSTEPQGEEVRFRIAPLPTDFGEAPYDSWSPTAWWSDWSASGHLSRWWSRSATSCPAPAEWCS